MLPGLRVWVSPDRSVDLWWNLKPQDRLAALGAGCLRQVFRIGRTLEESGTLKEMKNGARGAPTLKIEFSDSSLRIWPILVSFVKAIGDRCKKWHFLIIIVTSYNTFSGSKSIFFKAMRLHNFASQQPSVKFT